MVAYAFPVVEEGIPQTFLEANSSPDKEKWKKAMDEEMQSLVKNHTWKLARLPKRERRKFAANGFILKKKDFQARMTFATRQDW